MGSSVKTLEHQMKEGFETKGIRWREDYKNLQEKKIVKMEQGFKNEQNATQLLRKEIAQGFKQRRKCETSSQNESAVMKEEIKNLKMGSGSTVCSDAGTGVGLESGTFARPPPLSSRWAGTWIPRKMEFKGRNRE